jgi:hypothetical protein
MSYACPLCGRYVLIFDETSALGREMDPSSRARLIRALRQNHRDRTAVLTEEEVARLLAATPELSVSERRTRFLLRVAEVIIDPFEGASHSILSKEWPDFGFRNANEYAFWVKDLHDIGYAKDSTMQAIRLTSKGMLAAEELSAQRPDSVIGFVAMDFGGEEPGRPFSQPMSLDLYARGFQIAIEQAGYKSLRSGAEEHNEKICDRIIADIRRSRFVVADLSGSNANVFYEAGFARGLGLEVFLTCRRDLYQEKFDTRQFNTVLWMEPTDLARVLEDRIRAVIGTLSRP